MRQVDFYFDFVSPYAWLAAHQIGEVRDCKAVTFRFVPVLFAGLLNHHSNLGPAEIPAKRRYVFQDAQRWAMYLGLEFNAPPAHPFNPLKPLRVTSAVANDVADGVGLDGKALLQKAQSEDVKQKLRLQTENAIAAGVFGVPSFLVDGEIFWGTDRIHFLKAYLQGKLVTDKAAVEEILAR